MISPIVTGTGFSNALLSLGSKYSYKSCRIPLFVALYHLCYVFWASRVMLEVVVAFAMAVVMGWIL